MTQHPDVLNSWKEISQYLGRGVRTVQRWERDFALPVRRPAGHIKSSVIALRSDIDAWLANRSVRTANGAGNDQAGGKADGKPDGQRVDHVRLQSNFDTMKERFQSLVESNRKLQTNLAATISLATGLRDQIKPPQAEESQAAAATSAEAGSTAA